MWVHAARGAHGCWFPEELFHGGVGAEGQGWVLTPLHQTGCSFPQFNEAPTHKNWAMGPLDFSRVSQQHKAQLDCFSGEGAHLPAG